MIGQLLLGAELATSEVKQGHLNGTEPTSMLLHTQPVFPTMTIQNIC